jgi:small subunit ribosomal protein S12
LTILQSARKIKFKKKPHNRTPRLWSCPQRRGVVIRARIVTPRKPNSARRPVAKMRLSNYKKITAHIPGVGHTIKRYNKVYACGGGSQDLPGVRYSCIRGVLDCLPLNEKTKRRSIYGVKKLAQLKTHIRRIKRVKKV